MLASAVLNSALVQIKRPSSMETLFSYRFIRSRLELLERFIKVLPVTKKNLTILGIFFLLLREFCV